MMTFWLIYTVLWCAFMSVMFVASRRQRDAERLMNQAEWFIARAKRHQDEHNYPMAQVDLNLARILLDRSDQIETGFWAILTCKPRYKEDIST